MKTEDEAYLSAIREIGSLRDTLRDALSKLEELSMNRYEVFDGDACDLQIHMIKAALGEQL